MKKSEQSIHWVGRIFGGITVAGVSFILFWFWDTWELSLPVRIILSITVGILFLIFGGNVWRWIEEIDLWS